MEYWRSAGMNKSLPDLNTHEADSSDSNAERDLEAARLRLIVANQKSLIWVNLAISGIFAIGMYGITGGTDAFWLVAAMVPLGILRYVATRRHSTLGQLSADKIKHCRAVFVGITFVSALLWSAALVFTTPFDDIGALALSIFIIAGMSAGSVAALSVYQLNYLVYLLPVNLSFAARSLIEGDEAHYIVAAGMTVYVAALCVFARNANAQTTEVLRLNLDNLRLAKEMAVERDRATEASKAKSEFLSSMSHELRTPMNSILGFSQLLADDPDEPLSATHQRYIKQVLVNGEHLLALINQALDLSQIESGKLAVNIEDLPLAVVIEECVAQTRSMALERNIELIIDENVRVAPNCRADPMHFRQVFFNLLSNAIKYNVEEGKVRIAVSQTDAAHIRIQVIDTGAGIGVEQQPYLFEAFNRLGHEAGRIQGSGIGLTISKQLTELMNGQIGFQSEIGEGSTFWIELPCST